MQVQSIERSSYAPAFKSVYFTKSSRIMFNKSMSYITEEPLKTAKHGAKFIEDKDISKSVQKRYKHSKFIQQISKNNDTFIWHQEISPHDISGNYLSFAKIIWFDTIKKIQNIKLVCAISPNSQKEANHRMFKNLKAERFGIMY